MRSGRINSIDFWRGVVLVMIFFDHVPNTMFTRLTPRNFGFSDAAEAFIFLSGLVLAYVNWPRIAAGDVSEAMRRCARRAGQLYLTQIGLSLAAVTLFALAYLAGGGDGMLAGDNRAFFFQHPLQGLAALALLTYQFGYFNILSVYVVLMLMAAGMFLLMARSVVVALAVSAGIYVAARIGLMMPSWPVPYTWFLNPFAWQLLFTLGMVVGIALRGNGIPYSRPVFITAAAYVIFGLVVTTGAFGLAPDLPAAIGGWLDTDKGILGSVRLLHFLALAYVVSQIRLGDLLLKVPGADAIAGLGRQSLSIFAAGSILSAVAQIVLARMPQENAVAFQIVATAVVTTGIAAMIILARILEARQLEAKAARPVEALPFAGASAENRV